MHQEDHPHAVLQVDRGVADHRFGHRDLVVVFRVHEVVPVAVLVQEVVVPLVDEGALELLGGAVALGHLHAIGDAAHVELADGRALAGMDVLGGQDHIELAVDLDDIALSQGAGLDFHVGSSSMMTGPKNARMIPLMGIGRAPIRLAPRSPAPPARPNVRTL